MSDSFLHLMDQHNLRPMRRSSELYGRSSQPMDGGLFWLALWQWPLLTRDERMALAWSPSRC